ncbi:hypothetical protein Ae201684P_015663 [Aphanomyces euteiches]|uniref:Uncharacterized protein n=1 Tax=Aphanomyces euteiches TaxID=100861 RepID=A0A6G0WIM3_9STRA|nr:hypothetical protein Ae201684_014798 [Aphanomyces euteiches]KAH9072587.1 hypothetical protein Ae201684P_015663 [Aphanomyces euteiches]
MSLIESTNITYLKAPPVDVPVVESAAAQVEAARASFDFYVLAQSWQPYFCTTGDFPGCDNPSDYMTTQLTIHGLWPNYNSGLYPADCGGRYPQGWRSVQVLAGCQDARLDVRVERMGQARHVQWPHPVQLRLVDDQLAQKGGPASSLATSVATTSTVDDPCCVWHHLCVAYLQGVQPRATAPT